MGFDSLWWCPRPVVAGQELLTSDGLSLRASFAVTWRVTDPVAYTTGAQNADSVLYAAIQNAARDAVTGHTLDELLAAGRCSSPPWKSSPTPYGMWV